MNAPATKITDKDRDVYELVGDLVGRELARRDIRLNKIEEHVFGKSAMSPDEMLSLLETSMRRSAEAVIGAAMFNYADGQP